MRRGSNHRNSQCIFWCNIDTWAASKDAGKNADFVGLSGAYPP
jgi:hypothetical protein